MKKLIAGNWKMNGDTQSIDALLSGISDGVKGHANIHSFCDLLVCPPFPYITRAVQEEGVKTGGQDCSAHDSGAYTGEVSASMLKDLGCSYVILGHSERRQYHQESDALVSLKATSAHKNGLVSIVCVGETEDEREAGEAQSVVEKQIIESLPDTATAINTVIAYEPVWAIGTGKTASVEDVREMHGFIRSVLKQKTDDFENVRILYGGSMKPENAKDLLSIPNVDGGLIGGASLKSEQFLAIALAACEI